MPEFIRIFIKNQHLPKNTGWTQQLTNDAGQHSDDWGLKALKETLNKRLIMFHKGNLTEILCGGDVPWNYIYDSFTEADIIIISFDKKGKKIGSVRGFACIKVKHNDKKKPFLYIDLICNAPAARTRAAKQTYPSGTIILAVIKEIAEGKFKEAQEAGIPKCDFIKLRALESVITYYSLFGWEFLGKDDNTACIRKQGQSNRINKIVLKNLRKVMENSNSTEGERKKALRPFNAHLDDFYKDQDVSSKQFREEQGAMDGWRFSGTHEVRDYRKREDGYTMYKCLTGPRGAIHNEIEKNRKGDYRLSLKQVGINQKADIEIYYGRNLPKNLRPKNTDNTTFSIFRQAEEDIDSDGDIDSDSDIVLGGGGSKGVGMKKKTRKRRRKKHQKKTTIKKRRRKKHQTGRRRKYKRRKTRKRKRR